MDSSFSDITLRVLKMGVFHELLSSRERIGGQLKVNKCLTYDSTFNVLQANKALFERQIIPTSQNDDGRCEVTDAFDKNEFVKVLVCTSPTNNKSKMFPLAKIKEGKEVKKVMLIRKKENTKTIKYPADDQDSIPFHEFYITSDEFGEHENCFAQISDK